MGDSGAAGAVSTSARDSAGGGRRPAGGLALLGWACTLCTEAQPTVALFFLLFLTSLFSVFILVYFCFGNDQTTLAFL
jgi:hypothetical protein